MGWLSKLFNRSTVYEVTDTDTGEMQTFTIVDNLAPDFPTDDYRGGMGIPGAWRAAVLISDLLGAWPWQAFRERAGNPVERITPTPPLLDQPAPPETRINTFSSAALDLLWHGNAVWLIAARDSQGYATAVFPVPAESVRVRRVTQSGMSNLPIGSIEYQIGGLRDLSPADVIHVKGPCAPGALRGMGVLEAHLNTLTLAHEQNKQARGLAQNGVPTGKLKSMNPDLTEAEANDLKTKWMNAQRTRTVAVLNSTTDFEALSWNPEEMQLVEARKFTLIDIANIFGLDASWLNAAQSSRVYSNIETEGINVTRFTAGGHLARFEQALTQQFPRGTVVKANLDAFLRADTKTRYEAHGMAIDKGFLTVNEVRQLEDMPPLPEPAPELEDVGNE